MLHLKLRINYMLYLKAMHKFHTLSHATATHEFHALSQVSFIELHALSLLSATLLIANLVSEIMSTLRQPDIAEVLPIQYTLNLNSEF